MIHTLTSLTKMINYLNHKGNDNNKSVQYFDFFSFFSHITFQSMQCSADIFNELYCRCNYLKIFLKMVFLTSGTVLSI